MLNKIYSQIFKANAILIAIFGYPLTFGATSLFLPNKFQKVISIMNFKITIFQIIILEFVIIVIDLIILFSNKHKVLSLLYFIEKFDPEYEKIVDKYFPIWLIVIWHIILVFYLLFIIFSIFI